MSAPAPYGPAYGLPTREHPQGTLIFVLGILSVVTALTAPFAWYLGSKAQKEIRASGVAYSNESMITAGRILGMIFTILTVVALVFGVILFVVFAILAASQS